RRRQLQMYIRNIARTVALMRGPQALPPLIEDCFSLLQAALR
ncbi:LysR family transcriptional regulator, partial [Klebsiella pneumoniae]